MAKVVTNLTSSSAGSSGSVRLRFVMNIHSGFVDLNRVYRKQNAKEKAKNWELKIGAALVETLR